MKISFSATNPCHLYPLAREVAALGSLGAYYSGYPKWKLPGSKSMEVRAHSWRTNVVYAAYRLPPWARPGNRRLFRWQDDGFDRWVSRHLEPCDFIHAMPGQALHTFRRAKALGIHTVLNHATGPVREWVRIMEPEYARVGLAVSEATPYDHDYFAREDEEYALADFHCAASTVVCEQLEKIGIAREQTWRVPYGADSSIFSPRSSRPPREFRVAFAGQLGLRKGLRCMLRALELAGTRPWEVHFYGAVLPEAKHDLDRYGGVPALVFHGPISQADLAEAFRCSSVLVLASLEEGFGLVVPQALNTHLPCIVSDRVGAKDLIRQRRNGSVFRCEDEAALLQELLWWEENGDAFEAGKFDWREPAELLVRQTVASHRECDG